MPKMKTNWIDARIGKRIRHRRESLGLSLADVAKKLRISPQMVFCYEQGTSRLYISRLVQIARTLNTDVTIFIENIT